MTIPNGAPRDAETYQVIGAAMAVHRELGPGFLEIVYCEALEHELRDRGIPHQREVLFPVQYRGRQLRASSRVDFICYDGLLLELKALRRITGVEEAQILNYLKASRLTKGLLLNFGTPSLGIRRFIHQPMTQSTPIEVTGA